MDEGPKKLTNAVHVLAESIEIFVLTKSRPSKRRKSTLAVRSFHIPGMGVAGAEQGAYMDGAGKFKK